MLLAQIEQRRGNHPEAAMARETAAGLPADEASRYAATLIASSEGAVVMARAEQSMEPFDLVAEQLLSQLTG